MVGGFRQVTRTQARAARGHDTRIAILDHSVLSITNKDEYVAEISRLWRNTQQEFLTIGRYLVQALARLPHGEFNQMVENDLPFGYQTAYQLRCVAEAIDGGRFAVDQLPASYATIYQLTTLSPDELAEAKRQEPPLIRPDVKRTEIVRFKRTKKTQGSDIDARALDRRRATLRIKINKLEKEVAEITALLGDAEPELKADETSHPAGADGEGEGL